MGLPKEAADRILKGFTNQKLIASMQVGGARALHAVHAALDAGRGSRGRGCTGAAPGRRPAAAARAAR